MTARPREITLSQGLLDLYDQVRPHRGRQLILSVDGVDLLADRLRLYARLANSLETELSVHRLGEAERIGRTLLERAASDALGGLVADPEGKIIRPDFGGKR